jgi:hypothetical protein
MPMVVGLLLVRSSSGRPAARSAAMAADRRFGVSSPGTRDENIALIDY